MTLVAGSRSALALTRQVPAGRRSAHPSTSCCALPVRNRIGSASQGSRPARFLSGSRVSTRIRHRAPRHPQAIPVLLDVLPVSCGHSRPHLIGGMSDDHRLRAVPRMRPVGPMLPPIAIRRPALGNARGHLSPLHRPLSEIERRLPIADLLWPPMHDPARLVVGRGPPGSTGWGRMADPDPRRLVPVNRPGSKMVSTPLPLVAIPAIVVAIVPVDMRVAHHGVQHRPRIILDDQPVRVAIGRRMLMDVLRITPVTRAPIAVVLVGRAPTEEH